MAYLGRSLTAGNYLKLDDIESSFNGSLTTFDLKVGGSPHYPGSSYSLHVSLGGVVQEPEAAYIINQDQITFAAPPITGDDCFIVALGLPLGVGVPADGTVGLQHLQDSAKLGITTGGFSGYGVTQLDFKGPGVSTAYFNSSTGIGTVYFQGGGGGSAGAGGTWASSPTGISTTKPVTISNNVGVNTLSVSDADLVGVGNSFQGLYVSNGMIIVDNQLNGNHYIGTNFNGIMGGPVTVNGVLSVDGNYVVV